MECFFGAHELPSKPNNGKSAVVMFHIPDVGIRFKAPFAAVDKDHSDLASLLALLEFIDSNQKYFTNNTYELFGDNENIINQVNGRGIMRKEFAHLLQRAIKYREKYRFSLAWIPPDDNAAFESV